MTTSTAPTIAPATYRIDPARSTIRFAAKAMFLTVRGTFTVREGTITVADDVTRSAVTATVDATSIDTANTRRDNDLRSKKYLDTARHPDIQFTSREVTPDSVTGILRVHGTDQRVTLTLAPESTPNARDWSRVTSTSSWQSSPHAPEVPDGATRRVHARYPAHLSVTTSQGASECRHRIRPTTRRRWPGCSPISSWPSPFRQEVGRSTRRCMACSARVLG